MAEDSNQSVTPGSAETTAMTHAPSARCD
jgi:hypothetical protein